MIGQCPYVCINKTPSGYCGTSVCITPKYKAEVYKAEVENGWPSITKTTTYIAVIQCRDCKHRDKPTCQIQQSLYGLTGGDYCSYGELR